jgi:hypothetical protein
MLFTYLAELTVSSKKDRPSYFACTSHTPNTNFFAMKRKVGISTDFLHSSTDFSENSLLHVRKTRPYREKPKCG